MAYDFYSVANTITPSNTAGGYHKALYIGTGGNVTVNTTGILSDASGGTAEATTFYNVPSGTLLPVTIWQVRATNTTASGLVGLR